MQDFKGQTIIVTGAGNGIGKAVSLALAGQGAQVFGGDTDDTALEALVSQVSGITGLRTDVRDVDSIQSLVDKALTTTGRLDGLVCCAALFRMEGLKATPEDWSESFAVNVTGTALAIQAAAPAMMAQKSGSIVTLGSISAHTAQKGFLPYSATKGAVVSMTRCFALDLAPYSIRVNSVSPGSVWTEHVAKYFASLGMDRKMVEAHPDEGLRYAMKRFAEPDEIAQTILFLLSAKASFMTGTDMIVDGGRLLS